MRLHPFVGGGFPVGAGGVLRDGLGPNPALGRSTACGFFKLPGALEAFIVAEIFRAATEPARD